MELISEFLGSMQTYAGMLLSATIAALWTIVTKRVDYVNDYYKLVIKKRISACDSIELALRPFLVETIVEESGDRMHSVIAWGTENHPLYGIGLEKEPKFPDGESKRIDAVNVELHYVCRFTKDWVSESLTEALKNLMEYVADSVDIKGEISTAQKRDSDDDCTLRRERALAVYTDLSNLVKSAHSLLQREYIYIHDVRAFLKLRKHKPPSLLAWVVNSFLRWR